MSNIKHGFYSKNANINPDLIMIGSASLRSKALHKLVSLFDEDKLNVGHLYSAAQTEDKSLKLYFWDLVSEIEQEFEYESAQAKYANLIGLLALRIIEFNIDTNTLIKDMVILNPEKFSLGLMEYECNSIVTKIRSLRRKF